jgi:hypothetical protein
MKLSLSWRSGSTERDPLKFFQTIIDACDVATALFDRCKSINSFHNDQFDLYQRLTQLPR